MRGAAGHSSQVFASGAESAKRGFGGAARFSRLGLEHGTQWMNAALATEWARTLDHHMGKLFASKATIYDKAMDANYLRTHIRAATTACSTAVTPYLAPGTP
ncbi:MAG: hypothetical protein WDO24_06465 [Pseudomonadota bacterium]